MKFNNKNGYILILTILVAGAIVVFSVYFLALYNSDKVLALSGKNDRIAAEAAKAGIDDAIYQLKRNSSWTTGFSGVILPHSGASYSMTFNSSQPYFSTNNASGSTTVTGWNGRTVPPGFVHLVSTGRITGATRVEEAMVTVGSQLFTSAVNVIQTIILNGNILVDSFDSSIGPYSVSQSPTNGNLTTNSNGSQVVQLLGSTTVQGVVTVGTGGTQSTSVKTTGSSSYQAFQTAAPQTFPFFTPPTGTNLGNVSINGGTIILPPGTYTNLNGGGGSTIALLSGNYVFTGTVNLSGGSTISIPSTVTSPVNVYVSGIISAGGGNIVNNTQIPKNLIIYGGPNTTSVAVKGGTNAFYGIYTPAAAFTLSGNSPIFGSIVANSFSTNGNAKVHFDRALASLGTGNGVSIKSRW